MAWNRINENFFSSRVLVQCLWHIFILTCDMWHVPVIYRSASRSRMRSLQKVCKHSDVLYSICINKYTLLTWLKLFVLFIYIQWLVYLFLLSFYSHSDHSSSRSEGFLFLGEETVWNRPNLLVVLTVWLSLKSNFAVMFSCCVSCKERIFLSDHQITVVHNSCLLRKLQQFINL